MDPAAAAIGFLGVLVGALIGWFAGLAVARRAHAYAIELWRQDRDAHEIDLRKALGGEMRGNIALLTLARQKDRHGVLDRSAWTAAVGLSFRQDQSRQFLIAAYVAGAQYDEGVRQIPSPGQPARTEATNFARELARSRG